MLVIVSEASDFARDTSDHAIVRFARDDGDIGVGSTRHVNQCPLGAGHSWRGADYEKAIDIRLWRPCHEDDP
jgi:hypothetical protein